MDIFRDDNTDGYSENQLSELNDEQIRRSEELNLDPGTDDYHQAAKNFADEVNRR